MTLRHFFPLGAVAAFSIAADARVKITPEKVRDDYRTFTRITKVPKSIGAGFSMLCSGPGINAERVAKETGPHAMHYLHYYLNEVAQRHREARSSIGYPSGSVIVKEKLFDGDFFQDKDFTHVSAVTGMIKRELGSSPKTGDWEFFYFSPRSASADGKAVAWEKEKNLNSCVSCHSDAPDMVFGRFDQPYKMPTPGENRKAIKLEVVPAEDLQFDPKK